MNLKKLIVFNPIGLNDQQLEWALGFFLNELLDGVRHKSLQPKVLSTKHSDLQTYVWKFAQSFGYILPPSYLEGSWTNSPASGFAEVTNQLNESAHSHVLVLVHYSVPEIGQLTKLLGAQHRPAFREGQKYFVLNF